MGRRDGSGERENTGPVCARTEKHLNCVQRRRRGGRHHVIYATRSDVAATAGRLPSFGFCMPHPRSSTLQGVPGKNLITREKER